MKKFRIVTRGGAIVTIHATEVNVGHSSDGERSTCTELTYSRTARFGWRKAEYMIWVDPSEIAAVIQVGIKR